MCERDSRGEESEIFSSEEAQIQAVLLRHGTRFYGSSLEDNAENWCDHGFNPDDTDSWCEIGMWDAPTAAVFRDAGLTPEQVKNTVEGMEGSSNNDLIYAVCNGDFPPYVIIQASTRC